MNQIGRNMLKRLCQDSKTICETQKCLSKNYLCRPLSIQSEKKQKEALFPKFTNSVTEFVVEDIPIFDQIRNKFLIYGIIQPTMDAKFNDREIYHEMRTKIEFVCQRLSERDFESIEDSKYLTDYFCHELMANSSNFSSKQRKRLGTVREEDFVNSLIHRVNNKHFIAYVLCKGRLISEAISQGFPFSKKPAKSFDNFCPSI